MISPYLQFFSNIFADETALLISDNDPTDLEQNIKNKLQFQA